MFPSMSRAVSMVVASTLAVAALATPGAQVSSAFEVASIRPSPDGLPTTPAGVQVTRSQFRASYLSLRDYIAVAYRMPLHQVIAPEWLASTRFEIVATIPEGATPEQQSLMLQGLLVERFALRFHRESREAPVYTLEVADAGFRLPAVPEDAPKDEPFTVASTGGPNNISADLGNGASLTFNNGRFDARKVTLVVFAETLSRFLDRPVLDRTRLEGRYDMAFDVTAEDYVPMLIRSAVNAGIPLPPQAMSRLDGASIVPVQDGLKPMGLSLNARRLPLDMLVVDSMARSPTEN